MRQLCWEKVKAPEKEENKNTLKLQFIQGATPDVKKKLQKIEDLADVSLEELVKRARKVIAMREEEQTRKQVKMMAQVAREVQRDSELARKTGGWQNKGRGGNKEGTRRGPPLPPNVCTFCRKNGHWKQECPENPQNKGEQDLADGKRQEVKVQRRQKGGGRTDGKEQYIQAMQLEEDLD